MPALLILIQQPTALSSQSALKGKSYQSIMGREVKAINSRFLAGQGAEEELSNHLQIHFLSFLIGLNNN